MADWFDSKRAAEQLGALTSVWPRRFASALGAVLVGLVALSFAFLADRAQEAFSSVANGRLWLMLLAPPAGLAAIAALTRWLAPNAKGSGIPQVILAAREPEQSVASGLVSLKAAAAKLFLSVAVLGVGASAGREGPTVQLGASLMTAMHRLFRVPLTPGVIIAGGAAGVSAAFNTPLAGVAFAIEELAAAYEQRLTVLVMAAVMIAGLVSLGLAGDYFYFGAVHETLSLQPAVLIALLCGAVGGVCGGLFSRSLLAIGGRSVGAVKLFQARPVVWAAVCGVVVAVIGYATHGATWGTGYEAARSMVEGESGSIWFAPAKFVATLATAASGVPGGIFAPSLATGAGVGDLLAMLFPGEPRGPIVLLGMIAFFVGVVRAPLTGVVIVSEMTGAHGLILPLFIAAIVADGAGALVCRERLYHGLAQRLKQ
ncbi:MAG: chloride channel protein [Hyphomonadaceae bacterium]|nr:chloride channel protein [Hyphomonadaceae bacterium]MCA8886364.1 chloride channel protein [Hyphomonadaceae bacterium]